MGDRRGAKGVFLAGLGLFSLASLACGFAVSVPMLVIARLAQGAGAAPGMRPALGGLLVDWLGWRSVFSNLPVGSPTFAPTSAPPSPSPGSGGGPALQPTDSQGTGPGRSRPGDDDDNGVRRQGQGWVTSLIAARALRLRGYPMNGTSTVSTASSLARVLPTARFPPT